MIHAMWETGRGGSCLARLGLETSSNGNALTAKTTSPNGPDARRLRRLHSVAGTTLVELLVVIVVLSIGILAILQIFPSGLRILAFNRNAEIATKLAQDEAQRFVGRSDQMP